MLITTICCDWPIKCPKRVLPRRTQNPLILQAEHRANMLDEKAYFFGRMALWPQITRIPSKPQVVKRRARGRGVEVTHKVVFGEAQQVEALLATSATRTTINTSVVEREHLSWRAHNRRLTRKTIACSKALPWWEQPWWLALAS